MYFDNQMLTVNSIEPKITITTGTALVLISNNNIKAFPLMPKHEKWFDVADLDDLEEINNQDWAHTI